MKPIDYAKRRKKKSCGDDPAYFHNLEKNVLYILEGGHSGEVG